MKAIGIDLGGTNIKGVLVDASGHILKAMQLQTNKKEEWHWKKSIKTLVHTLQEDHEQRGIPVGLSAPGLAGKNNDRIVLMPGRLAGLEQFVWSDFLETPTWVLNDAHAALLHLREGDGEAARSDGAPANIRRGSLLPAPARGDAPLHTLDS